jgi:hypothetical protein
MRRWCLWLVLVTPIPAALCVVVVIEIGLMLRELLLSHLFVVRHFSFFTR